MRRLYRYVGPRQIAARPPGPGGRRVDSPADVVDWVRKRGREPGSGETIIATFVVDETGALRIADRRSEHFSCSGGRPVWSAGEVAFRITSREVEVEWVTNQSTGYCPGPDSWPAVASALARAGLVAPAGFDPGFVFRRCARCEHINIVKGGVFECGHCGEPLPTESPFAVGGLRIHRRP